MAVRWAIASGAFSSTATWNDGGTLGIPTTGDNVFTNSFTVNMDVNATVISLNNVAKSIGVHIISCGRNTKCSTIIPSGCTTKCA